MTRQYNSSRRRKAAAQTRREILQAALKLHWEGTTEFEPLAREAGCSLATLRKHFPSKEALFQSCTRSFAESLTMPDITNLAKISEPTQCIEESVSELCRIHEAMFGYAWHSSHQRKNSPTLDAEMDAYEGLANAIADLITPTGSSKASLVRGLLDFLTYRALRISGLLSPSRVREELISTIQTLILGVGNTPASSS
jgi:AcrR family transcriptional regulator